MVVEEGVGGGVKIQRLKNYHYSNSRGVSEPMMANGN